MIFESILKVSPVENEIPLCVRPFMIRSSPKTAACEYTIHNAHSTCRDVCWIYCVDGSKVDAPASRADKNRIIDIIFGKHVIQK